MSLLAWATMDSSCSGVTETPCLDSQSRLSYLVCASRALYLARRYPQLARLLHPSQTYGALSSSSQVRSSYSGHRAGHCACRHFLQSVLEQAMSQSRVTVQSR